MDFEAIAQDIGILFTLAMSGLMLYRAKKMLPIEQKGGDADAAKTYAEAAKITADQMTSALKRIGDLETQAEKLEGTVVTLTASLTQRDKCIETLNAKIIQSDAEIRKRDVLIADWTKGIKILIAQLQKAEIVPDWTPQPWDRSS